MRPGHASHFSFFFFLILVVYTSFIFLYQRVLFFAFWLWFFCSLSLVILTRRMSHDLCDAHFTHLCRQACTTDGNILAVCEDTFIILLERMSSYKCVLMMHGGMIWQWVDCTHRKVDTIQQWAYMHSHRSGGTHRQDRSAR